jgi:hypothetical protein
MVIPRNQLRPTLSNICRLLTKEPIAPPAPVPAIAMLPQSDDVTSPPNA